MRRWRGHGWSRLSHGVHTGGGQARITVTLVSVGPRSAASPASPVLTFQRDSHCSFFLLVSFKLMVEAARFIARG